MVYCGKPSKGCQCCRDRKTRCDKKTPSCSQCIRTKRQCPGYRSQLDLMFRNESKAVVEKVKSQQKAKLEAHSDTSLCSTPNPGPIYLLLPDGFTPTKPKVTQIHMWPTLEERSLGYFVSNASMWFKHFDLIDAPSISPAATDEHLLASMSAVGLAAFSHSVHRPELMVRACRDYGTALQLTNAALHNPAEVKRDSTLFAVMILSIFETVTGSSELSFAAWTEHINGATALVRLRGKEQLKTPAGQRMFLQVSSNLMLSCIQRSIPMPQHIVELRKSAESFIDVKNPAWRVGAIIIDFTVLRASIRDRIITEPARSISSALEIDARFSELFTDLPESWNYRTVYTDATPHLIWNGSYHVYNEFFVANIWNGMRTCRILLHEIIRVQLLATYRSPAKPIFSASETLAQNTSSEAIMRLMRDDILGSVPHHTLTHLADSSTPHTLHLDGSRSYFVLWPLYIAGAMNLTTVEIKEWVIQKLQNIGTSVGLRQALVVAQYLESKKDFMVWEERKKFRESTPPAAELDAFFTGLRGNLSASGQWVEDLEIESMEYGQISSSRD